MGQNIFADCLLDNSWAHRSRRSWMTLSSFGVEAIVIGVLAVLPIVRNVALPAARTISTPVTLGSVRQPVSPTHPQREAPFIPIVNLNPNQLLWPSHHPQVAVGNQSAEIEAPGGAIGERIRLPLGPGDGPAISIFSGTYPVMPAAPARPTHAFRTSTMLAGSLIRRVEPGYPPIAKAARIQGAVVLFATISTTGVIENLRVMSGHPFLVGAAIDAVKQWRYRPYILNGEPIEVETEITVNFVLGNQ